jgi:hypothetical protein
MHNPLADYYQLNETGLQEVCLLSLHEGIDVQPCQPPEDSPQHHQYAPEFASQNTP